MDESGKIQYRSDLDVWQAVRFYDGDHTKPCTLYSHFDLAKVREFLHWYGEMPADDFSTKYQYDPDISRYCDLHPTPAPIPTPAPTPVATHIPDTYGGW